MTMGNGYYFPPSKPLAHFLAYSIKKESELLFIPKKNPIKNIEIHAQKGPLHKLGTKKIFNATMMSGTCIVFVLHRSITFNTRNNIFVQSSPKVV